MYRYMYVYIYMYTYIYIYACKLPMLLLQGSMLDLGAVDHIFECESQEFPGEIAAGMEPISRAQVGMLMEFGLEKCVT